MRASHEPGYFGGASCGAPGAVVPGIAVLVGGLRTLRGLGLSDRARRGETGLAVAAAVFMAAFVAGAGSWVLSGGPAPKKLFQVGAIDVLALVLLTGTLVLTCHAVRRAVIGPTRRPTA